MTHMKKLLLLFSLSCFLLACPDDKPAPVDTSADIETDGISSDVDVTEPDGDTGDDANVAAPTIAFHIEGAQGAVGVGEDTITLGAEDDLDPGQLGVQVNVSTQTTGVETGRIVSVFIDGAAAAAGPISATEDAGSASIAVTLNASPGALVRLEVTNQAGELAAAEKTVTVVTESCTAILCRLRRIHVSLRI